MSDDTTTTDPTMNPDLKDLHDKLVGMVSDLADQIGDATSSAQIDAITTEIAEINHRVTITGNVLFAEQTAAITKAMDKVNAATKDVQKSIKEIEDITGFVKDMTAFLSLVDKVIDTAKLVLPGI